MKKRILACLLMMCMLVTMLPATAFAAEYPAVSDNQTTSEIPQNEQGQDADTTGAEESDAGDAVFWNPYDGSDDQDGSSENTAVKTLGKAQELLAQRGLKLIYLTNAYTVTEKESWDLAGATIQRYGIGGAMIIMEDTDSSLTLANVVLDGAQAGTSSLDSYEPIIKAINGGTVVLNRGAVLENNRSSLWGAGIYGRAGFALTMNDGAVIRNNTTTGAHYGGGVMIGDANSSFTMNGGEISGNTANRGGGVAVIAASMTMSGGTISNNKTYGTLPQSNPIDGYAGGLYIADYHSQSTPGGNEDYGPAPATFTMTGGSITRNTGMSYGGGILAMPQGYPKKDVTLNIQGGEISNNEVTGGSGGGIAMFYETSHLKMSGGEIKDNSASTGSGYGGGIILYTVTGAENVVISGGTISGNKAWRGGGVALFAGSKATMSGGSVMKNQSVGFLGNGGGFFLGGTLNLTGGEISGNTAQDTLGSGKVPYSNGFVVNNTNLGSGSLNLSGDAKIAPADDVAILLESASTMDASNNKYINVDGRFTGATQAAPVSVTSVLNYSASYNVEPITVPGTRLVVFEEAAGGEEGSKEASDGKWFVPSTAMLEANPKLYIAQSEKEKTWQTYREYDSAPFSVSYQYTGAIPDNAPAVPADEQHWYLNSVTIAEQPSLDGYDFSGWKIQSPAGIEITNGTFTMPNNNVTLVGSWIPKAKNHTVTFLPGAHGTLSGTDSYTVLSGSAFGTGARTVPNVNEDHNYDFTGWLGSDGKTYTSSQILELIIVCDMTFTAQYKRESSGGGGGGTTYYILHYESNGGTEYKDERYSKNTVVKLDKVPTREGYTFTGWYADKELTDRITSIKMTSDKTVYAGWEPTGVPEWLNGDDHFAYVIGYTDGTVRPLSNISRAEVAAIFFRLLNEDIREENLTSANTFTDVNDGMWCNMSISTIAKLGIVKGRTAERFDPNAPITRAEFAAICARFDTSKRDGDSNFTDISGHWAEAEIERAASLGWIMGYTDGTFRPENYITRAEAMTMINRVLNRLPEDEDDLLDGMNVWPDNKPGDWYYLAVQEATNSHDFTRKGDVYERWTKLNADPDWSQYQ
ncbi:S-layer homology domain-containing protein [Flavonifractor plautii]|jgi:uncharacterized repeat protein (TIGR02543 family)|uniref:SLH domain-containing protein n=2 Tax=Bacteria TaxID=2 RepID=A0A174NFH0_FLAPL|nr:S-layer homology domain-containing protein [Flavonifractor plautii]MCB6874391.1 S-layer homology domain-containing protein [Flavonifractor plautii]MCB7360492.1 S-layer homology domain-containing protein [Flavonifractor plautii]MCQ4659981.1 S-layer homology domain-containing protein [Flavonifractor plautii]MCQ4683631.1 S-layer homology domain-containing protein [Flavonifractor plautii]MCQ4717930.1 S-layer homology domain-containing protein [Flavonifractor plautii]